MEVLNPGVLERVPWRNIPERRLDENADRLLEGQCWPASVEHRGAAWVNTNVCAVNLVPEAPSARITLFGPVASDRKETVKETAYKKEFSVEKSETEVGTVCSLCLQNFTEF
jgi:hypothetical protein